MNHPAGIDLAQFLPAFFDEAGENLERMEQLLLAMAPPQVDDEQLNAVFRCAHSVKGGAASFGFGDVAELTHRMETLLDRLRRHELAPTVAMVDALLACGDTLRALLARHRHGHGAAPDSVALCERLRQLADGPAAAATATGRALRLSVGPTDDSAVAGLRELFDDIADLGRLEPDDAVPAEPGMHHFRLHTGCSDAELVELFSFHVEATKIRLAPLDAAVPASPAAPAPPPTAASVRPAAPAEAAPEAATLRVPVEKVDLLLNQVGELVVAQSMLLQACAGLELVAQQRLEPALAGLQRHARELQDTVMAVRMVPMATVFGRFPRMLRELAAQLGKRVELVTEGEATELDKGLIERIVDPLTHLVRNALDHGIEPPAERRARGKPEAGTLTLSAAQDGTSVVVEVRDDGAGLSRARLLAKARERGLQAPDTLNDEQVWALIFAPGFSTATAVTEVSGRGVGMDVVQRNVAALGGSVEIDAREGRGMRVRVRLPLTLAIMDAMLARVADEIYVLPLATVLEAFRPEDVNAARVGGARVVRLRDTVLPVISLQQLFAVPAAPGRGEERRLLVAVEADGHRLALEVDELIGQQQVVVKNLLEHCGRVEHVSAATVLGDGSVALILDIGSLARLARRA